MRPDQRPRLPFQADLLHFRAAPEAASDKAEHEPAKAVRACKTRRQVARSWRASFAYPLATQSARAAGGAKTAKAEEAIAERLTAQAAKRAKPWWRRLVGQLATLA